VKDFYTEEELNAYCERSYRDGFNAARGKVLNILATVDNHGMTHSAHCGPWHGAVGRATDYVTKMRGVV
jgi:hypothetical protein